MNDARLINKNMGQPFEEYDIVASMLILIKQEIILNAIHVKEICKDNLILKEECRKITVIIVIFQRLI